MTEDRLLQAPPLAPLFTLIQHRDWGLYSTRQQIHTLLLLLPVSCATIYHDRTTNSITIKDDEGPSGSDDITSTVSATDGTGTVVISEPYIYVSSTTGYGEVS